MSFIINFLKSIPFRVRNWKTTIGGGVLGVIGAALVGHLEQATGCHFQEAFAGIDWVQLLVFILSQIFGALTTDADKKVDSD